MRLLTVILSVAFALIEQCHSFVPIASISRSRLGNSYQAASWSMMPDESNPEVNPRHDNPDDPSSSSSALPVRIPLVDTADGSGQLDVYSRLLQDRIVLLGQSVENHVANTVVSQLLYLATDDPQKDITLYINCPGGSMTATMAIYDAIQYIPCDVSTMCFGVASSMGALLLSAGTKGKRRAMPNSRIMIRQPLGGAQGQAADLEIQAKEILYARELVTTYLAAHTNQTKAKIETDCERDFFMTPDEAVAYGLIDEVVNTKTRHLGKPEIPDL